MVRVMVAAAAATALLGSSAQGACWRPDEASAATVRELQSMLMVAALRCQTSGHSIMADYNAFVLANKAAIASQNEKLKAHFIHAAGPVAGQRAYDAFTTSRANGYGAGASGPEACAEADALAREATMMMGSLEGLQLIAERQGLVVTLPEGACAAAPGPALVLAAATVAATGTQAPDEPMAGDETVAATHVAKVDPAVALAGAAVAAAPPAAIATPVAAVAQAPVALAAAAPPPVYQPAPAYYPAPAYAPAYQPYPAAPYYAPQMAYQPAPRWAPPQAYAYAPPPGWVPQR